MRNLKVTEIDAVSGGLSILGIELNFSNLVVGVTQGIPMGVLFGGKYTANGGWAAAGIAQGIGAIVGGILAIPTFGISGLLMPDDDFRKMMLQTRQNFLVGGIQ